MTKLDSNVQSFNTQLATKVGLISAILIDIFISDKLTCIEIDGIVYIRTSFDEIQSICPYLDKDTVNTNIKHIMQENFIKLFADPDSNVHRLFLITDKCKSLVDECTSKPKRKRATKVQLDIMSVIKGYEFENDEANAIAKWINHRTDTYGLKKTEQAIKVQCNNLLDIKQNGYSIPKVIEHVMKKETWENIKPEYVYEMQKKIEKWG